MDDLYLFPPDDNTPMKPCKGTCGRTLPATTEYFHKNRGTRDGLLLYCKQCQKIKKQAPVKNPRVKVEPAPEGYKRCTGPCGQVYLADLEFFHAHKGAKNGLHPQCKTCTNARIGTHRSIPEVKERHNTQAKTYQTRPEVKEKRQARWEEYSKRPEVKVHKHDYDQKYHSRPEVKKRYEEYYNLPEVKRHRRDYRDEYKNRPEVKAYQKRYRKKYYEEHCSLPKFKERSRAISRNRKSRKRTIKGSHTPAQIQDQLKRQKHKCYYCQKRLQKVKGTYIYHIEHTFPISRVAGTDIPANSIDYIVLACPDCNLSKGDKFPWEWLDGGRLL